jgi:hypothetical protein
MSPWFILLIVVLLCLYMLWNNMFWNNKYSKHKNKEPKPVIADFELSTEIVEEILSYLGSVGYDFKDGEKDSVRDAIYQIVSRKNSPINEPPALAKHTEASLCGECKYIFPKECHPQTENHHCSLYNKRLYHLSYHPDFVRLPNCHKSHL